MRAIFEACIKVSVESVAEYVITLYSIHNNKQNTLFKTLGPTENKTLQKKINLTFAISVVFMGVFLLQILID